MSGKLLLLGAALMAGFALLLSQSTTPPELEPPVIGKNNTVLFLTNCEDGLSNVHVATAHALLERHPETSVHFASFAPMGPRVRRISAHKGPGASDVVFHEIEGDPMFKTVYEQRRKNTETRIHPPGLRGIRTMCRDIQMFAWPWTGEQHMELYLQVGDIIDEVDPAVVVLDVLLRPGIDATRMKNRLHSFIIPNTLIDAFIAEQPHGALFWKYPAMGSGIPYPVPWSRIPENILLNIYYVLSLSFMTAYREKQAYVKSQGLSDPVNPLKLHRPDAPYFSQSLLEASRPVDVVPQNVTCTGPITLRLASAAEQDPELAAWLERAPTVLVNLGGAFKYTREYALAMAGGVAGVLEGTEVQVLWKFAALDGDSIEVAFDGEVKALVQKYIGSGRLRVEKWLGADPTSLLETGHVVASVHHGGAGCYHEAVAAGVPAMILPLWLDLYNFAQLVEDIGIGVWGCRETSPEWNADCLREGLMKVVDGGRESKAMRAEVKRLGEIAQSDPGRYVAAREIAKLASAGRA